MRRYRNVSISLGRCAVSLGANDYLNARKCVYQTLGQVYNPQEKPLPFIFERAWIPHIKLREYKTCGHARWKRVQQDFALLMS